MRQAAVGLSEEVMNGFRDRYQKTVRSVYQAKHGKVGLLKQCTLLFAAIAKHSQLLLLNGHQTSCALQSILKTQRLFLNGPARLSICHQWAMHKRKISYIVLNTNTFLTLMC